MAIDAARAKSLFLAAAELADPAARAAYLERECGGDAALRARVEALLRANDAAPLPSAPEAPVDSAPGQPGTEDYGDPTARVGAVLAGKYKLVEAIGEGGMGSVFMAQQTEPVKRAVAVKVIKAGMDSRAVLARFEAERQALAMMDHPNIAKVLDAGTTDGGRPFFVMELVKGTPITRYCDERKLTPRQRLELFVPVCLAIQHAHLKGIIHRDIKPSNVLVALYDDRPVPKVIDFGVAKAAGQALTDKTLMTGFGAIVGTPEYMSPEQASLNNLDIDTRSDVYSLGVLLYELLTGTTPVDKKSLGKAALLEILRIVREVEAPRPSAKLSSIDTLPSVAANRGTEPARLSRLMKGELDWLVLKALEKDRTRRYETANGLARDIQRYLADEIVEARPPSASYRLRKFVKKNRAALTTAAALAFLMLTGITISTWQAMRATHAESAANAAADAERRAKVDADEQKENAIQSAGREAEERKKADAAKQEAQAKEAEANAVVKFFEDRIFAAGRPKHEAGGLGHDVALRDAIKASLPALGTSFTAQPLVEARLRLTLGNTLYYLGDHAQAAEQDEKARALFTRYRGPNDQNALRSMANLAQSYAALNRHAEAVKLYKETLAAQKRVLGPDHPDTLAGMNNLALGFAALGRHKVAFKLFEETLVKRKRVLGPEHPDTLRTMNNLALISNTLLRHAEALKLGEEALAACKRVLPPDHPDTLWSMSNLATFYRALNRHAEALKLCEEALAARKRVLGLDHPSTLVSMGNLAQSYVSLNRHAEALPMIDEFLAKADRLGIRPLQIQAVIELRVQCCQKLGDVAGCRITAEMWEKRTPKDAVSLYDAACFRAVTAALQVKAKDPDAAGLAKEDADKAMAWLTKAVAAGWTNVAHMKKDTDLDSLRDREDFKKLLVELEAKKPDKQR
jgi:serine/threonine protein kinase